MSGDDSFLPDALGVMFVFKLVAVVFKEEDVFVVFRELNFGVGSFPGY